MVGSPKLILSILLKWRVENMWTRQEIKGYAKDFLRKHYWKAFAVCLIATLLSGGGGSNSSTNSNHQNDFNDSFINDSFLPDNYSEITLFGRNFQVNLDNPVFNFFTRNFRSPLFMLGGATVFVIFLLVTIIAITIGYAIEVGRNRFFLQGFQGDVAVNKLFSTFNKREYVPIVKTMFLRNVYTILWTFLLIIPGIVKSYEYRFVPYLLSEMPNLSPNEIITKSREMTRGHKLDMLILDLSFLGWYFLGGLLFGIGTFFVNPYAEATNARLYAIISDQEISLN